MSEGFEPEVRKYFRKILYSICYGLGWMSLNVLLGMYLEYGVISGKISVANVLFYLWFFISLSVLLYYYYRIWKNG